MEQAKPNQPSIVEIEQRDCNTALVIAIVRLDNTLRECTDRIVKRLDDLDVSLCGEIENLYKTVR